MSMSADELRWLLGEFITEQRRLERLTAWGEPTPTRLADATGLLESARSLLAEAEVVIREGPEPAGDVDAEDACTCLAILVPSLLASVGYEDPPPPTFTGILADLAEARDTLRNPRTEQARAEALECLDDIIDLVGEEAEAAPAGEAPGYWRLRLQGAVRVSRALIPHLATTTAIALVSSGSGGPFTAALSTVGTSIAALLLPTAKDLSDLFRPPELRPSAIALHRMAAETAMEEERRLLVRAENGEEAARHWAEQAHAAAGLHQRVLARVLGENTAEPRAVPALGGWQRRPNTTRRRRTVRGTAGQPSAAESARAADAPDAQEPRPTTVPRPGTPNTPSTDPSRSPRPGGTGIGGL
ncbi:hypothetical protein AB0N92_25785 [Streptomyces sp. NPDC093248]|uniref:hypothetical protein n=1 Tax=Streptomyces sp. NPDC093248 TaxID=3155072 RepID=UPI00341B4256